jgi:hypothetical protein
MNAHIILLIFIAAISQTIQAAASTESFDKNGSIFYVDIRSGDDMNPGSLTKPFQSLERAVKTVSQRVENGFISDKIYLRSGVYRPTGKPPVLYPLHLKGTVDNYSIISAMPATPDTPGAIQRSSGQWYENVIIDDSNRLTSTWKRTKDNKNIWISYPEFQLVEWHNALVKRSSTATVVDRDKTPRTSLFTIAPYMILQDNEPTIWAETLADIDSPGKRTYDHKTGALYLWPFNNVDPNETVIESWKNGPNIRFRDMFDGIMEYAAIEGIEFRMVTILFKRHDAYQKEDQRIIQRHVRIKDNKFSHGWLHIFVDVGGNKFQGNFKPVWGPLAPHFDDRAYWHVTNNVFYHPSREVFQIHGPGHIFEFNKIIEHGGPWAGPMTYASAVNTRNTNDAILRNNYVEGHFNNFPVFLIELSTHHQKPDSKDCMYGGQKFENNIFFNMKNGTGIYLGRGGCRMQNILVRNNIFKKNLHGSAITLSTPHKNLTIQNNIFYEQNNAINIEDLKKAIHVFGKVRLGSMDSTISISNNVFIKNNRTIHPRLLNTDKKSSIRIDNNLFHKNRQKPVGDNSIFKNPLYKNPVELDFSLSTDSPARTKHGIIVSDP